MTKEKRRVLVMCFVGYTVSYLLRTNLSAVLDRLLVDMNITRAMAGVIGSLFFWTYAAGQLMAGYLAERVNPKIQVVAGLLLSCACNASVGLASSYFAVLTLWGLNGLVLSMVWSPTFKILTNWFDESEYRKVSVWISLPTTIGYLMSWGLIRTVAHNLPWRAAFFLPAICGVVFAVFWMLLLKPVPEIAPSTGSLDKVQKTNSERAPISKMLLEYGLPLLALVAIVQGLIKEGINLWGPTLLSDIGGAMGTALVSAFSIFIPVASTLGILFVGWLIKRLGGGGEKPLGLLFGMGFLASCCICIQGIAFVPSVLLMGVLMACVCGANVLITVFIPMRFSKDNISAQLAGALNFLVYVGAGLGGGTFGLVSDAWGWRSVYWLWAVLCLLAVLAIVIWRRKVIKAA